MVRLQNFLHFLDQLVCQPMSEIVGPSRVGRWEVLSPLVEDLLDFIEQTVIHDDFDGS